MTIKSEKGKRIEELAKAYKGMEEKLNRANSMQDCFTSLSAYADIIQALKDHGITVKDDYKEHLDKIVARMAENVSHQLDTLVKKIEEEKFVIYDSYRDVPQQFFKGIAKYQEEFSHSEDEAAVFAPRRVISGRGRCALKLYANGEFLIGSIENDGIIEGKDGNFREISLDKTYFSSAEVLWLSEKINIAKAYKRLIKK